MANKKFKGLEKKKNLFNSLQIFQKTGQIKKPPAYEWQDLALKIIKDLNIPSFKKSSVFKACKENSRFFIEKCLNDTKELCKTGQKWKYFFKLISELRAKNKNS